MNLMLRTRLRSPNRLTSVHGIAGGTALLTIGVVVYSPLRSWQAEPAIMILHSKAEPSVHPTTIVRPIACTPLQDVAGKSITTAIVHFPPNAYTPEHRHPGSVTAFVLSGTIRSQISGEEAGTYTAGQTWFEPPGAVHSFSQNVSMTENAELLATFIADTGCGPLTIFD